MRYGNFGSSLFVSRLGKPTVTVSLSAFHKLNYVDAFASCIDPRRDYLYDLHYDISEHVNGNMYGDFSEKYSPLAEFVKFLKKEVKNALSALRKYNNDTAEEDTVKRSLQFLRSLNVDI
jgi:hypothetical protein